MKLSNSILPVTVVQASSILFNVDETIDKFEELSIEASRQGAKLAVFPEAFLGGYPYGFDFGARIGYRTDSGRETFLKYYESAIEIPSPHVKRLSLIAKSNKIHLVTGIIERELGTLYCTVLFFSNRGTLMGKHRKIMPTALERLVWGFGDGSTLTVIDTEIGRIGAAICWENYMPAVRMSLYGKGVQLYCAPTADCRDTWLSSMRHIALEGRCFVLSACQHMTLQQVPEPYRTTLGNEKNVLMRGGSCIVDPLGNVLAGPNFDGEILLHAELDMNSIIRGKYDFDVIGHYSRPDLFSLHVNESKQSAVRPISKLEGF